MHSLFVQYIFLVLIILALVMIANKLRLAYPIVLVFLLGGIISPPDAISATTIMRRVNVPKAMVRIVEGESLLNDASSLIVFRFALAAVIYRTVLFPTSRSQFRTRDCRRDGGWGGAGVCLLQDPRVAGDDDEYRDRSDNLDNLFSRLEIDQGRVMDLEFMVQRVTRSPDIELFTSNFSNDSERCSTR